VLRLYTVHLSTNVERVELALAHKGLAVEKIQVPFTDRSEVRRVSGQDLVPVLVDEGRVVHDSMEIVRYLEDRFPDRPSLYPIDPARRAECFLFIDWFNRVWKRAPNEMAEEMEKGEGKVDAARVARLGRILQGHLDLFEQMLTGREYVLEDYSAADMAAFPFVKFATIFPPGDSHLFHQILRDYQKPGSTHPNVRLWIERMNGKPRA
jgi:glutathione S-transferase